MQSGKDGGEQDRSMSNTGGTDSERRDEGIVHKLEKDAVVLYLVRLYKQRH